MEESTCIGAANGGHLSCLEWLLQYDRARRGACENGLCERRIALREEESCATESLSCFSLEYSIHIYDRYIGYLIYFTTARTASQKTAAAETLSIEILNFVGPTSRVRETKGRGQNKATPE